MKKITQFLWLDGKAEAAVRFYVSIFKNSKIVGISRYGEQGPGLKGSVMVITFQLDGQEFCGLNGGPQFTFSPAISFAVNCKTQKEIDELWEKLSEGGKKQQCGWVTDKYGVAWQVVPSHFRRVLNGGGASEHDTAMKAVLQMNKLDMEGMKQAYEQP